MPVQTIREQEIKALATQFIVAQLRYRDISNNYLQSTIVKNAVALATELYDFRIQ